jgi:subtilase family serine protease
MIRNTGGVACAASTSRIVVKQGTTILQTFSHNVPTLAPSATYFYTESFTPVAPGVYTYSVESDQNQVILEANEANNVNTYTISVTPCLPDFVVETCDLSSISNTDYVTNNMTLNATITNVGVLATSTPLTVRFQFSNNTFVDVVHLASISIGQSVTVNTTIPAFVNTSITMKAIADPNNVIVEMNEANNESFSKSTSWDLAFTNSVLGCGPDFTNFNHKPFFQYSLPVKIANYNLYVADTVKVKYEIAGPGLVGNVHLATVNAYQVISNCAACPLGVSLPSPFAFPQTGTYTLTLTIDPDNQYAESDELNNVWVSTINVSNKPDMRVFTSYINPSLLNPALGQPVTVSVSYDNVGSSNVNDVMKMKLFIDNIAIDSASNLTGLATNNYATVNFNVPWSSAIAGTHVIKAIIDSDNDIVEDEEDNNSATRALTVGSSANLYVDSLSVFNYYPNINDSANIKSIIKNEGDLPTNAFVSIYYVNNNLDSILIQTQSISLQDHDSVSLNTPWIVVDNKTKIVVIISNSSALEYNYSDNTTFIELGKMALFTEAFPACDAGNTGTMIAHVIGGEPPYTYAWSNGASNQTIQALANSYSVTVFDATGQQVSGADVIPPCGGVIVKVKCFLEGYYSFGAMESVLSRSGIISPLAYTDTVLVELHATTSGFPTTSSSKAILHNDGSIICEFASNEIGSNRYIVLKHRNGIETWSANPMLISNNMVYDFTSAANKAYGSNQTEVENGVWAIFSGDVNQDENIDLDDFTLLEFDINNFSFGYFATDINGDGNVDLGDTPLVELNNNNFIYSNHPTP